MRIQNQISFQQAVYDYPLNEMTSFLLPRNLQLDDDDEMTEMESRKQSSFSQEDEVINTSSRPISIPGK